MLDLTFGQTYGSYDSIPANNLPSMQKGLGSIIICIRHTQCVNELTFDLVVGQGTCPQQIRDTIRFRVDINQPLQAQADVIINNINQLLPMLAINWTTVLNTTSFTLTGLMTGIVNISGSAYGDYNTTVSMTYANPVALSNTQLVPGTPFLVNLSTYPTTPFPVVTSQTGVNSVSSGPVPAVTIGCGTPPAPPPRPCRATCGST